MVAITDLSGFVLKKMPSIKTNLRIAHNRTQPELFVKKASRIALYAAAAFSVSAFFLFAKRMPILSVLVMATAVFAAGFFFMFLFILNSPKAEIRKRERDIDKEVLFAGRYLLVKVESGSPLVNTLADASKSFGVSGKYFAEIMDDINTGMPLEVALENARTYNASSKFKRILWQLVTALKTGAEITSVLRGTLQAITAEQTIEIKRYAKKLNSLMLFYMIIACVAPSLGLTMLIIISGFLNLDLSNTVMYIILFFLAVVQFAFLILVKSARPTVDL